MAKEIITQIRIQATPLKIWSVFTEFAQYPHWNPFIKALDGDVRVGKKIRVHIQPPDSGSMVFKPKVLVYEENKKLSWIGRLLLPGIFDGEHAFELIDNGDGTTTFVQSEIFKGLLVPLFQKTLDNNTRRGFEQMNLKLKEMCENESKSA